MIAICVLAAHVLAPMTTFHDFQMPDIDGHQRDFKDFRGKVVLVVNVASRCGLTPQYTGLESLYESYKDKGFAVLGFPCNDFREQEPGTDKEIKEFCSTKYNVTFPLFAKVKVLGEDKCELYKWLVASTGGEDIEWNFGKFLIDKEGKIFQRFSPKTGPDDPGLVAAVKALLDK
jgi:glutathione peroxidase